MLWKSAAGMIAETVIGLGIIGAALLAAARWKRAKLYRELNKRLARIADAPTFDLRSLDRPARPGFSNRLAVVKDFLPAQAFAALKAEAEKLLGPERSYVPTHKKGGTVAYETLIANAPAIISFY